MARLASTPAKAVYNDKPCEESVVGYGEGFSRRELPPQSHVLASLWSQRSLLAFSPSSFDFLCPQNRQARIRRSIMVIIVALRSAMIVLSIFSAYTRGNVAEMIVHFVLSIPSLWLIAFCLAAIGDAAENNIVEKKTTVSHNLLYTCGDTKLINSDISSSGISISSLGLASSHTSV